MGRYVVVGRRAWEALVAVSLDGGLLSYRRADLVPWSSKAGSSCDLTSRESYCENEPVK